MDEVEGSGGICRAKKPRPEFDFDRCFEDSNDDPPPEIVIVKSSGSAGDCPGQRERSQPLEAIEGIGRLSDQELEEKIRRFTQMGKLSAKLPDKGEKLKSSLRAYEEERDHRKQHRGSKPTINLKRIDDTESSRPRGAAPEARTGVHSGSRFADLFTQKLENDKCSHTRIYDAFDKEPRTLTHGDRDRRKRKQKTRVTDKGRYKNGVLGKGALSLASSERIFPNQDDLAQDTDQDEDWHKLKNAFKGLHSDKSSIDKTVVLLDEEDIKLEETLSEEEEASMRDMDIYYPSSNDPKCVEVQYKDLKCLDPGEYLTGTIMNFWIRFLQETSSAADDAPQDFHFFNTYFYKKLQEAVSLQNSEKEASFNKLRRWWRGVNIFDKAYLFLPVHQDLHWSLAIVCIPDIEDESGPIILHLDSLGYHQSGSIFENIKRFLREEWNTLREETGPPHVPFTNQIWEDLPRRVEEKIITVPRQNNDSDCGLFVLYFMERFIKDAPQRLRKWDLGMFGRRWFKPEEASALRRKIKTTLHDEFRKARRKSEPIILPLDHDDSAEESAELWP